nr:putative RNA-directed DNA polymerase [Tanacetum cinerariifolium]
MEQALNSVKWKKAMDDEMEALKKSETWDKCNMPQGKKAVGCRWVFTVKYKPDGTVELYKARLVAKGYTQTYGIDYSETFSPVAKMDTVRVLLSVASNQGWPLHQFDVKNAFLHGELKEEVYMEAPPGFPEQFKPGEVCRLKKSLYGLKQSPRAWFGRFTMAMKKYGFRQSNSDHTLFLKRRKDLVTCLIIYVDDMVITGNDKAEIKRLRDGLFKEFEMKDLGNLKYFLGIEIYTDADWAGDKDKRRSTSGYFSLVGGNLVTWRSKKQKVVALSSAEAEF